jgi:hypothetical protein
MSDETIVYLVFIKQGDTWDVRGVFKDREDAEKEMECMEDRVGTHNLYLRAMELL